MPYGPPKFTSFQHAKYIDPIPTVTEVLTHSSNNSKSKILSKHYQLTKSQVHLSSFKSGIDKILGMIYLGTRVLSTCGPLKLENKLSASKIQ